MNNRTNEKFNVDYFVVDFAQNLPANAGGGTAGAPGNDEYLVDPSTGAINLDPGQLGVVCQSSGSSAELVPGAFLSDGKTPTDCGAISLALGTAHSQDYSGNYGWPNEIPPFYESGIIRADKVLSWTKASPNTGHLGLSLISNVPDDLPATSEYTVFVEARSVRRDRDYGANVENWFANFRTPDWTAMGIATGGAQREYTLAGIARNLNLQSKLYNSGTGQHGNRDFVVLAVGTGGTTALSALNASAATPVTIMTADGTRPTLTMKPTPQLIQAIAGLDATTKALTIIPINQADLTDSTGIEGLLFIGLPQGRSLGLDNIYAEYTRLDIQPGRTFASLPVTTTELTDPKEPQGHGALIRIDYEDRAFAGQGTFQLAGHSDELVLPPNPIDPNKWYVQYILDFFDTERTKTVEPYYPKRLVLLQEATLTSNTANAFAATAPARTFVTTLTDWIKANPGIEILGDATATAMW